MNLKKIIVLTAVLGAALGAAGAAQARDDVQFSVAIGAPAWGYAPQPVVVAPAYGYYGYNAYNGYYGHRHEEWRGYREPTRWDRDGDGIPNRYDRVYNPRWDRDGDGVPNRRDPNPDRPNWRHY